MEGSDVEDPGWLYGYDAWSAPLTSETGIPAATTGP
jgi:hypothetical protein